MFGLGKKKNTMIEEQLPVPFDEGELSAEFEPEADAAFERRPTGRDPYKLYTIVVSAVVVILGALIFYTAKLVRDYETRIDTAMRDYSEVYELGKLLDESLNKMGPDRGKGLGVETGFFYEKASESGIQSRAIKAVDRRPTKGSGYTEWTYTVTFNEPLTRQQVANFLYNVEASHPVLKAADIKIAGANKPEDKSDLWTCTFKFRYREPER
jgi:hypothetical protein